MIKIPIKNSVIMMFQKYFLTFLATSFLVPIFLALYPSYIFFYGMVADATVINIELVDIVDPDIKREDRHVRRVTYLYEDAAGTTRTAREDLSDFASIREGDSVKVIYLPSRPDTAMIYQWINIIKFPMLGLMAPAAVLIGYVILSVLSKAKATNNTPA